MKNFLIFLLVLLPKELCGQEFCSTPYTISNIITRGVLNSSIIGVETNTYNYYLRVYYHVIRMSDGRGSQIVTNNIQNSFNILQSDFNPHKIFFVWDGTIDYIDNSTLYDSPNISVFQYNNHSDGIDIYLFGENSQAGGLTSDIGDNRGFYIGGYLQLFPSIILANSHVVSHEMGHVLGLYHTHHGTWEGESDLSTCAEFVDGSNSETCGDYIEDTPADPLLNFNVNPVTCEWLGGGKTDSNGDFYLPDTRLIMSYTHPACMSYFSNMQGRKMRYNICEISSLQDALVTYFSPEIFGLEEFCNNSTYHLSGNFEGTTINWDIDNNDFTLIPSGAQCVVRYNHPTPQNTVSATLSATIRKNGITIETISRVLYVHGSNINVTGSQLVASSSGELDLNEINISGSTLYSNIVSSEVPLNGNGTVNLYSVRFIGMNIHFSGIVSDFQHNGNRVSFKPSGISNDLTLCARSNEGCSDFNLYFIIENNYNSPELLVSLSGSDNNSLYVTLTTAEGTEIEPDYFQQATWTLNIKKLLTGQTMTTQQVTGSSTIVNISSYAPGVYIVNASILLNGEMRRYSTRFIKEVQ